MDELTAVALISVWVLLSLNLWLMVRVIKWIKQQTALRERRARAGQLRTGTAAPEIRARTLDGREVSLADFRGRSVAFIFVSTTCYTCRDEMPDLVRLAPIASTNAGVDITLVSSDDSRMTRTWLEEINRKDGVNVDLPVLIPVAESTFLSVYNPEGSTPYFCLVDPEGRVAARSLLVEPEWAIQTRKWKTAGSLPTWMGRT